MPSKDDNAEIIKMITTRLAVGELTYGHGFRVMDDTRTWGTPNDDWVEMALEEAIDGALYLCAQMLRIRKTRQEIELEERKRINESAEE